MSFARRNDGTPILPARADARARAPIQAMIPLLARMLLAATTLAGLGADAAFAGSAKRLPSEDYIDAYQRVYKTKDGHRRPGPLSRTERQKADAWDLSGPVALLDLQSVPSWSSETYTAKLFNRVRDVRFLQDATPNARRISWLYPDDGCFARADLARSKLAEFAPKVAVKKIFAFGNLSAKTPNAPDGHVQWWYHVAPIVRVGAATYVLDPSLEPRAPLPLASWLAALGSVERAVICDARTYMSKGDPCLSAVGDQSSTARMQEQSWLLREERKRIESLGRNATKELGDRPPWRKF